MPYRASLKVYKKRLRHLCTAPYEPFLNIVKISSAALGCIQGSPYLSAVGSVIHHCDPALEDGHLEQGEVGVAHVVEGDHAVLPREVEGEARVPVRHHLRAGNLPSLVNALTPRNKNKII